MGCEEAEKNMRVSLNERKAGSDRELRGVVGLGLRISK